MAFTYVPKDAKELSSKSYYKNQYQDIAALLAYLNKTNPSVNDPLCLSNTNPKEIKVTRRLSGMDLKKIKADLKLDLTLSWGEGSRKVGATTATVNKGIKFENDLVKDINRYIKGEKITDQKNDKFIKEFVDYYKLTYLDKVLPMGELNQKRPLKFSATGVLIGGSDFNIGKTVTDVTVEGTDKTKKSRTVYLSLKYGKTVTFANPGIATLFPVTDFSKRKLSSSNGKSLLKMLGLDEKQFIDVFNAYQNNEKIDKFKVNILNKMNKSAFQQFLMSGIGYGYHMVHLLGVNIKHKEMTKQALENYTTIQSAEAYYGGMGGSGPATAKRVDIIITTPVYKFKINLRSKSAGKVYPTHLMIDYEYRN